MTTALTTSNQEKQTIINRPDYIGLVDRVNKYDLFEQTFSMADENSNLENTASI